MSGIIYIKIICSSDPLTLPPPAKYAPVCTAREAKEESTSRLVNNRVLLWKEGGRRRRERLLPLLLLLLRSQHRKSRPKKSGGASKHCGGASHTNKTLTPHWPIFGKETIKLVSFVSCCLCTFTARQKIPLSLPHITFSAQKYVNSPPFLSSLFFSV